MFNLKRAAAVTLSLAMLLPDIPTAVMAEETNTWKFDFGYAESVADGYIAVTPDMNYFDNTVDELQFGFLGITDDSYSESYKYDGYTVAKGQKITLKAGGTQSSDSVDSDYITVPSASEYLPEGASAYEGRYPIRFAMKVTPKTYYTVTAVLANSSATENAVVSLQSEKRHIIDNNIVIEPNQTKTYTFNVDVEDYQYKSEKTAYEDDMLNIIVAGKNAALASLEVTKHGTTTGKMSVSTKDNPETIQENVTVNDGVTLWCCDDSTGCDQVGAVPYFELQNYAGVCQELSKYVPDNIAVSNQGEGGLNSADTAHRDMCYLKEGDYLYVEYGHNDNDGASGYKERLESYYTKVHAVGAKLIIVSPIERHNDGNFDTDGNYKSGFGSFVDAGKAFVEEKITAGATDIAFVDLNAKYVELMDVEFGRIVTASNGVITTKKQASDFFYRSVKGSKVDGTHINDAGADWGARAFFEAAQAVYDAGLDAESGSNAKIQSDVLSGLVTNWHKDDRQPYVIPNDVVTAGAAPNSYWDTPITNSVPYKYDTAIMDITQENGKLTSVSLRIQNDPKTYEKVVVTVTEANGTVNKYYAAEVVDSTADLKGTQKKFTEFYATNTKEGVAVDVSIPDGAVCTVKVCAADDDWIVDEDTQYSIEYTVKKATETLLTEDGSAASGWTTAGSATTHSATSVIDENDTDTPYMKVLKEGSGSCNQRKALSQNISGGLVNVRMKMRYNSGLFGMYTAVSSGASLQNSIALFQIDSSARATVGGTSIITTDTEDALNNINTGEWFDVDCIMDFDNGTVAISVAGSDYVTTNVSGLQTNSSSLIPTTLFAFATPDSKSDQGYDVDVKDISITTIERTDTLPKQTVTAEVNDTLAGRVTINGEAVSSADITRGNTVTFKAVPNEGYEFVNWTDEQGAELSISSSYVLSRLYEGVSITANFKSSYGEGYTVQKIDEFTDDFEDETNIFGITEKSTYTYEDSKQSMSVIYNPSILPTGANPNSKFGNILVLGHGSIDGTSSLHEQITLNERQSLEFSLNTFNSLWTNNNQKQKEYEVSITDNSGSVVAGYTYSDLAGKVTSVTAGGTIYKATDGEDSNFEDFTFYKSNYIENYDFTNEANAGKVEFTICGDGNVTVSFSNANLTENKDFTGKIDGEVTIQSLKLSKEEENDYTNNRTEGVDNFKALLVTAPETHKLTVNATDIKTSGTLNPTITLTDSSGKAVTDLTALYGTYDYKAELADYHTSEGKIAVYDNDETLDIEMIPNTLSAVRSVDEKGNVLKTTVAESDEDTVVYYPVMVNSGSTYYRTDANTAKQGDGNTYNYGKYFASAAIDDVTYTKLENCVYYAEAEDIISGDALNGTIFSQGKAQYQASNSITINLPAGIYGFYVSGYAANNTHVYVQSPESTKSDYVIYNKNYGTAESCFTTIGGDFTISTNYPNTFQMDYIYVLALQPQDVPKIAIDYENETLTGFDDGSYTIENKAVSPNNGVLAIDSSWYGTAISVVKKGDGVTKADSAEQKITIPARPDISSLAIDNAAEHVTIPEGYYYGTTSDNYTYITNAGTGVGVAVEPGASIYIYKAAVTDDDNKSFKSEVLTLTAPARETSPSVTIDYENETLSTTMDIQYLNGSDWTGCTADMAATAFGWNDTAETKVKFRASSTSEKYASDSVEVTIPARPAAPTGVSAVPASDESTSDGKITGVNDTMEYKLSTAEAWNDVSGTEITGLAAGAYYVRYKAVTTDGIEAFAGANETVTVSVVGKHTITFKDDNGNVLKKVIVSDGEFPSYGDSNPTKEQDDKYTYEFIGWDKTITAATEDTSYTAKFEKTPRVYTVTYYKNDGTIENESNYTSYTYGVGLTLPTPLKDGYTFDGWYDNESCTGDAVEVISDTATGNKTY
ncbi:MAG: InlB B-repeat-containing protein, partial [Hominilimicola sp.]